jgi:hypothetical protein
LFIDVRRPVVHEHGSVDVVQKRGQQPFQASVVRKVRHDHRNNTVSQSDTLEIVLHRPQTVPFEQSPPIQKQAIYSRADTFV